MQGRDEMGVVQIRQGIAAWRATGAALHVPYLCTLLVDVAAHLGSIEEGLQALAEAHTLVEQHEERWWEAEIHRLRGILLQRQTIPQPEEAEACFQRALEVARRQQTKVPGAARRYEPGAPVAAAGQACGSPRTAGAGLRLVHRGL